MDHTRPSLDVLGPVSVLDRIATRGSPPLRHLLESTMFRESPSRLTLAMGEDCAGLPCIADLQRLPHLIVGGTACTGKSMFLRAALATLLLRCDPADLQLFVFSETPADFANFVGLPHLLAPVTRDPVAAEAFLDWAHHEMNRRYAALAAAGVRNVDAFNVPPPLLPFLGPSDGPRPRWPTMPRLVGVFDDLRGMAPCWRSGSLETVVELLQMSRAVGIHLVMATEDLSVETLPSRLLANVAARLSFRQASRFDSVALLGTRGAEELTERGEALFMPPAAATAVSLRTPWLDEASLGRLTAACRV